MSSRVITYRKDPLELLERMLNRTTLSTKRASHSNIIDIGHNVLSKTHVDIDGEKQQAVEEALEKAEKRATKELKAALSRQHQKMTRDREKALDRQKEYYETLAKRVAEQRDRAEEERARELRKKFEKEMADALQAQYEELQIQKEREIEEACNALRIKLRNEFAIEKELAIAEALAKAREQFRIREQATIERVTRECEEKHARHMAEVRKAHQGEMRRQQKKYDILDAKYRKELAHKERVECDFRMLQTDYRRFIDYTDGKFHSDYMMSLRSHGERLAGKRVSVVTYEDIQELDA